MSRIYPPVATAEYADKIAMAVERGVLRIMPYWRSREACQAEIDRQYIGRHRPLTDRYVPTLTIVAEITESAGAEGMDCSARDALAVGHRTLGENYQEARHVA